MSASEGNHDHSKAHGAHAAHDAHGPPPPPEPKTPMWLTAVGAVLFLLVGMIWGLSPSTPDDTGAKAAPTAADAGAPSNR
jgi:hypothetical protein